VFLLAYLLFFWKWQVFRAAIIANLTYSKAFPATSTSTVTYFGGISTKGILNLTFFEALTRILNLTFLEALTLKKNLKSHDLPNISTRRTLNLTFFEALTPKKDLKSHDLPNISTGRTLNLTFFESLTLKKASDLTFFETLEAMKI
jgi:hypothetical protein